MACRSHDLLRKGNSPTWRNSFNEVSITKHSLLLLSKLWYSAYILSKFDKHREHAPSRNNFCLTNQDQKLQALAERDDFPSFNFSQSEISTQNKDHLHKIWMNHRDLLFTRHPEMEKVSISPLAQTPLRMTKLTNISIWTVNVVESLLNASPQHIYAMIEANS